MSVNGEDITPEQALAALRDAFLACRTWGHAWRLQSTPLDEDWGRVMVAQCASCRTTKTESWGASGVIVSRSYEYPDGYVFAGRGWNVQRADSRQELLRRVSDGHDWPALGLRSRRQRSTRGAGRSR